MKSTIVQSTMAETRARGAPADSQSERVDQGHRGQTGNRTWHANNPLVAPARQHHERGDGPSRQGGLFQPRMPLDLRHQPVPVPDRIEGLGRRPLLSLAPEFRATPERPGK